MRMLEHISRHVRDIRKKRLERLTLWRDKEYIYWNNRRKGNQSVDYVRGPGYYLPIRKTWTYAKLSVATGKHVKPPEIIGRIEEFEHENGQMGVYKLIGFTCYSDPPDMVKEARYTFIGYKGLKPINDCTWDEYKEYYYEK